MTACAADAPRDGALPRAWAFVRRHALTVYAVLALLYLLLPIAVVVLFSFNDPVGRFNYTWEGFTLDHWTNPGGVPARTCIPDFAPPSISECVTLLPSPR